MKATDPFGDVTMEIEKYQIREFSGENLTGFNHCLIAFSELRVKDNSYAPTSFLAKELKSNEKTTIDEQQYELQ